jgi:outer membrane protein assembly factor BamE (lipoprotein component of BamABCDE complex)
MPRIEIQKTDRIQIAKSMLFAVASLALVSGCSSGGPSDGKSGASVASSQGSDDEFQPPFRGETRDQVIARYGDPDQVFQSQNGETWVYFFGKAKQFIPFYGPFAERRILTIHFDPYGGVIGWESRSNRPQ